MSIGVALVGNPLDLLEENPKHKRGCKCAACEAHRKKGGSTKKRKANPKKKTKGRHHHRHHLILKKNPKRINIVEDVINLLSLTAGVAIPQVAVGALDQYVIKPTERMTDANSDLYVKYADPAMRVGVALGGGEVAKLAFKRKADLPAKLALYGAEAAAIHSLLEQLLRDKVPATGQ